ncbi:hypothetical protein RHS04_09357 [Rhizoctonia solani]|uniref:Uncharacterized protein n=1 Tax=Rhizoctonia solani TaxID=456999 RepID=A0A8H7LFJ6_9AGAM|nr:hypothetical protein RHS04_09357 [Rhizoctonia solani]
MIVNKTIELWPSEASSSSSSTQGDSFPFSIVLEGDDEAARPIPASGSTQLTRAQASVAYVSSNRDPVYSSHNQPLLPPIYAGARNEKRPQISESEWHSDDLLLERSRTSSEPSAGHKSEAGSSSGSTVEKIPRLWVPRDLRYPSGKCIPFMLSLPTARADSGSDIESGIEVQLVRVSTIQARAGAVQQASTVCRGRIQPSPDQGRTRTLRGTIDTGSSGKDFSWNFESLVANAYEVRATIKSSTAGLVWGLIKGVELTTHEWSGERAGRIPSLDSPVTSRTGAHIVRVNF